MSVFKCRCGRAYRIEEIGRSKPTRPASSGWTQLTRHKFSVPGSGIPEVAEATRETPLRAATVESEVTVPAVAGTIVGFAAMIVSASLLFAVNWIWKLDQYWTCLFAIPIGAFFGGLAIIAFLQDARKKLSIRERVVASEDEDEWRPTTERLHIEVKDGNHTRRFMEIDGVSWEDLQEWAQEISAGAAPTVHSSVGRGARFTRPQFDRLMSRFETLGWMENYGGPVGRKLTPNGQVAFRKLARGDFSVIVE